MLRSLLLLTMVSLAACGLVDQSGIVTDSVRVSPTPLTEADFSPLKVFAEEYEPKSGNEVIPSPPDLDSNLNELITKASKTETRAHEPYIILIFLKLSRFHTENFKQSYELGRTNPLTKEFYRLVGESNYEKSELITAHLAERYVRRHPELLKYQPIQIEMKRIEQAAQKIENEGLEDHTLCSLMKKPDAYVGKNIRLSAVFNSLSSSENILTSTCDGKPESVATYDMEDDGEGRFVSIRTKMNSQRISKADVIVVGKLIGPRDKDSGYGYGHMGWSKYQFEISNLVTLSPVVEPKSLKNN